MGKSQHKHKSLTCVISNSLLWWLNKCCLFSRQLGGLHRLVLLLVFLTRKQLTKSKQWARRTAAHCAFTSYRPPYKRPRRKIKGRGTGTLACFFSFFSLALFKGWKGSFKPLRIVLEKALCWRNCYIKALPTKWYNPHGSKHQFVFILKLYDWWRYCWLFCAFFGSHFFMKVFGLTTRHSAFLLLLRRRD